jgi:HAD superfamily hydrolase (TIGR01450 family)
MTGPPRLGPPERRFRGYALDLDGTVYLGDTLLPGAAQAIQAIRAGGGRVAFVTNKPLETAAAYADKLTRLGVPAIGEDVVTSLDALIHYLHAHHPGATVLTIAEPLVAHILDAAGFPATGDPGSADLVVVAFDRTFHYDKLLAAYRAVRHGAPIVATNPDPYCPTPDGGVPDCAAILAALETCTGTRAEAIVGKPSAHMAKAVLHRLEAAPHEAAVVGDRPDTDIAMARRHGMAGILVLNGTPLDEALPDPAAHPGMRPDYVVQGLHQLLPDPHEPEAHEPTAGSLG